jgi:hypothetical protein
MTLLLAQRLVSDEALPRRVVEAALLHHAKERLPFVASLIELYPHHAAAVTNALDLASGPPADDLSPDAHLMARLPIGLCSQLFGFPIGITSSSGVVDVLVVDPLDEHIEAEFRFHLSTSVRLVRGRLDHVSRELLALEGEHGPRTARQDLLRMNEPIAHSNPPIPLTRLVGDGQEGQPGTHRGVAPPAAVDQVGVRPSPQRAEPDDGNPSEADATLFDTGEAVPQNNRMSLFAPSSDDLQEALSELAVAEDPDNVVDALIVGLRRISKEIVVFSVRGDRFRSRGRSDSLSQPRRDASIEIGPGNTALARAVETGQYLGPLVEKSAELAFLEQDYEEVCVTRVDVMERPLLVIFAAGFLSAYDVSLRSDHLARAASDALMRIVLAKKR